MVMPSAGRKPGIPPRNPHDIDDLLDQHTSDISGHTSDLLTLDGRVDGHDTDLAAHEAALAVGSEGDLKATVGGVITNIRPGRIDARVRGLSTAAAASANRTRLAADIAEAASLGAEYWIPEGIYPADNVTVPSFARIAGRGTLRAPTPYASQPSILRLLQGTTDVLIEGITLDGNNVNNPLQINDAAAGTPVERVTLRGVTIRGTASSASGDLRLGVRGQRARHITIELCTFEDLFSAINAKNWSYVTIRNNRVDTTVGHNAVYLLYDANLIDDGRGVRVLDNEMVNIGRMGVELWSQDGTVPIYAPEIDGNLIELASAGTMGISSVTAHEAKIRRNTIRKAGTWTHYGIEHSGDDGTIAYNEIEGFLTGISLDGRGLGNHRTVVDHNTLKNPSYGITLANTDTGVSGERLTWNRIIDPIEYGITVGRNLADSSPATRYFGEWEVAHNYVERRTAMAGDGSRTWCGIALGPARGYGRAYRNWVVVSIPSVTAGMTLYPYFAHAGLAAYPNELHDNIARRTTALTGATYAPYEASGAVGTATDWRDNKSMDEAGAVSAVSAWS